MDLLYTIVDILINVLIKCKRQKITLCKCREIHLVSQKRTEKLKPKQQFVDSDV